MSSSTLELQRHGALILACVLPLTASLAGCRQATAPNEPEIHEPASGPFGASLGSTTTSTRKVLDLVALRTCLELGAERDWRSTELERLRPLFDAATARSKSLEQRLATTTPPTDANELLRRILWARELDRLTQEREEMGGALPEHLTRFGEVNNDFMENCADADYRDVDLRTLVVDYFGDDGSTGAKN